MLSPADMLILGAAALMFFGPDQLPKVARKAGKVVRDVQASSQSFIREMERAADESDAPVKHDWAAMHTDYNSTTPFARHAAPDDGGARHVAPENADHADDADHVGYADYAEEAGDVTERSAATERTAAMPRLEKDAAPKHLSLEPEPPEAPQMRPLSQTEPAPRHMAPDPRPPTSSDPETTAPEWSI